ncbi:MAG TPA: hypothetical protein VHA52_11345 [Candidatus Babeliaceae bacterium]|nr:hypothetical protein [Candidatus Babeliaceae bacterium]
MNNYYATMGQSLYDICLNTYGSLDYLLKLMLDNSITTLSHMPGPDQQFVYDTTLVANQQITQLNYVYATIANDTIENNSTNFNDNFDENFD